MKEIVKGFIECVKNQLKTITTSTDKTILASFKMLEKNMFVKIRETEMFLNWKLKMNIENIN